MKHLLLIALLFASASAFAQNKINGPSISAADSVEATVEFNGTPDFGDIRVEVISTLADMAVVRATGAQLTQLADLPQVRYISVSRLLRTLSDGNAAAADPETDRNTAATATQNSGTQTAQKQGGFFAWLRRIFSR